jgi:hypothetical protein
MLKQQILSVFLVVILIMLAYVNVVVYTAYAQNATIGNSTASDNGTADVQSPTDTSQQQPSEINQTLIEELRRRASENIGMSITEINVKGKATNVTSTVEDITNVTGKQDVLNETLITKVAEVSEEIAQETGDQTVTHIIIDPFSKTAQFVEWNVGGDNSQAEQTFLGVQDIVIQQLENEQEKIISDLQSGKFTVEDLQQGSFPIEQYELDFQKSHHSACASVETLGIVGLRVIPIPHPWIGWIAINFLWWTVWVPVLEWHSGGPCPP